jgi:pimeloyl-ACP methyl ester carboxylesterase
VTASSRPSERGFRHWWARIRRVWAIAGLTAGGIFVAWSLLAYRASSDAWRALSDSDGVQVSHRAGHWQFQPSRDASPVGLIFLPGALVDPVAYAPITAAVARAGYPAVLIEVPMRGAFGRAESPEVAMRMRLAMSQAPGVSRWVLAGHSLGGRIATSLARTSDPSFAGLILIGTSHPRDYTLAHLTMPVIQIYGSRDTVADEDKVVAARRNLPPSTHSVRIDGGNHSQFGYYGFQPGDWPATITREAQQALMLRAILEVLNAA